jgi:hypothetical protein
MTDFYEPYYVNTEEPITEVEIPEDLLNALALEGYEPDPSYTHVGTSMYQFRRNVIDAMRRELDRREQLDRILTLLESRTSSSGLGDDLSKHLGDTVWELTIKS